MASTTATVAAPRPIKAAYLIAPAAVMAVVLLMIVPLPPLVLDLLLSIDIGLAVVLLFTAIYVKQPVEFSVFPSLLLLLTLMRLSLNVASTRLVLLNGAEGMEDMLGRALTMGGAGLGIAQKLMGSIQAQAKTVPDSAQAEPEPKG